MFEYFRNTEAEVEISVLRGGKLLWWKGRGCIRMQPPSLTFSKVAKKGAGNMHA